MFSLSQKIGFNAERKACRFLQQQGLILKTKNYRCAFGEIDLVMADHEMLVFVEVRYRRRADFGDAIDSVDHYKEQRLLKTAEHYVQQQRLLDRVDWRFDLIGITKGQPMAWIKNAFDVQY